MDNNIQDSLINKLGDRKTFRYNGYYILGRAILVHITPNLDTGIVNDRTYTTSIIGINSEGVKLGFSITTDILDANELEANFIPLEGTNKLQMVSEEELVTARLIYSDQSTESTVEARVSATVSGSDLGGQNDQ